MTSYTGPEGSLTDSYDPTNQLTGVTGAVNESFSYDLNGNRTMTGYSTGTDNRLLSDGTYNYTYDNEGNLLTRTRIRDGQVISFGWDYRNRLTEVTVQGGDDEKFTYDVNNNRIGVWLNGVQQSWTVYDGQNPYLDFTGGGTLTERYLAYPQALDQLFARVDSSGSHVGWYLTDSLGSVRQIVDGSNGTVLDQLVYTSYGSIYSESNAGNGDRFKYAGGEYDSITGDYRFGARYYDPNDGRFISEDPKEFTAGDSNLYRYVGNQPTRFTDPSGLQLSLIGLAIQIEVVIQQSAPNEGTTPNPEQTDAIAKDLQKEIDAWQATKEKAEADGRWGDAEHADTQIQILENEIRKLFGLPPKPWKGG